MMTTVATSLLHEQGRLTNWGNADRESATKCVYNINLPFLSQLVVGIAITHTIKQCRHLFFRLSV